MHVDAHQHFLQMDREVYDWITDDIATLRLDFLPSHLAPLLVAAGVKRTVLVQASETLCENDFMERLAKEAGFVGAIVAWLDLTASNAVETLEDLARIPLVKGVRPVLQGIEDTDWILRKDVLSALRELPRLDLRFDALITERHLPNIAELAERLPDLPIVIDHAAKPDLRDGKEASEAWRHGIETCATRPNVHCKFSGLITEHGPGWSATRLRHVIDHLVANFGAERLMWGSDWPVLNLEGSYAEWHAASLAMLEGLSENDREMILGGTAAKFYEIDGEKE